MPDGGVISFSSSDCYAILASPTDHERRDEWKRSKFIIVPMVQILRPSPPYFTHRSETAVFSSQKLVRAQHGRAPQVGPDGALFVVNRVIQSRALAQVGVNKLTNYATCMPARFRRAVC